MLNSKNARLVALAIAILLAFVLIRQTRTIPATTTPATSALATGTPATGTLGTATSPGTLSSATPTALATAGVERSKPIASTGSVERDAQIRLVIASMDSSGKPPNGVAQGGTPPGAFRNREGRLPRGATYIESDIWPSKGRSRGTERLIFGRDGDVWFTADHYESFKKIR